jgi:hypothetical protein
MEITYNTRSSSNARNLITFTDVPNILKVSHENTGRRQKVTLTFVGSLHSLPHTDPWTITLQGDTISSVDTFEEAVNRNFLVAWPNETIAASVVRALRNCPNIMVAYTIHQEQNRVILTGREIGGLQTNPETNIPPEYLLVGVNQGTASSQLFGAKVDVDVYNGSDYVTTLEKNAYNGEAAFNMSPVLAAMAKRGQTQRYEFKISTITASGGYNFLDSLGYNYIIQGYMCNQGEKYLELSAAYVPAQNFSRGESKPSLNNTLLYVYDNTIPFSFYTSRTSITPINVIYRNSLYEQIGTSTWVDPEAHADGDNRLVDTYIELDCDIMKNAFYVDVKIDSQQDFVRYNVIKPLKATEYSQRILWRNSYGGISFFDFTGAKTETRDVDITTYQKNIFGYYTDTMNELEKVYNNEIKYSVTLKSHLFENDGKYLFNDLAQSPDVWTVINHETYAIIIDNISVDETDRNNIYESTVRYHYSQHPSII